MKRRALSKLSHGLIVLVVAVDCGGQSGGGAPGTGGVGAAAGGRGSRDAGRDAAGGNPTDASSSGGARGGVGGLATGGAAGSGKAGAGGAGTGAGGAVGGVGGGAQGGGSGGRCTAFQFQPSHATGVHVLADMNGDGRLDVVAASSDSTGVHVMVYRQTAPRVFAAADQYDYATGNLFYYEGMAVADLDQDGVPDVAISEMYGSVLLMLSGGGGGYRFASPRLGSPLSEELDTVAIADFDGDGYRDIAVSIYNENLSDGIYWGLGGGAFSVREDHKHCIWGSAVGIVDANEDGRPDLAVACSEGGAQVLINQGGRSFTSTLLPGASETYAFATGDLNSDHHVDVVIPNVILNQLVPSLGDGHGNFAAPTAPLVATTGTVLNAAMGDLDGDGNADVLLTSIGATTIALYRGFGGGYFQDSQPFPIAPVTKRITVGDIDGDGVADLLDGNGPQIIYGPCP